MKATQADHDVCVSGLRHVSTHLRMTADGLGGFHPDPDDAYSKTQYLLHGTADAIDLMVNEVDRIVCGGE